VNTVAQIFVALAGVLHLVFFALESVLFRKKSVQQRFLIKSEAEAEAARPWAFNQGFYNLFLALGVVAGLILLLTGGAAEAGFGVAVFGLLCMVLAAVVLIASNPKLARSALIQGAAPLVGVVLLVLGTARSGA
jgi:putative membrane protein